MTCGKLCYDRTGAKLALAGLAAAKGKRKGRKKAVEKRMYYCMQCAAWHLTSKAKK